MSKNILLIQGHPDVQQHHLCNALERSYSRGATDAGHEVRHVDVARKGLTGRSARVVVTMGMPALVYRWYFRAHSLKSLERNILGFVGIAPINETLIGNVGNMDEKTTQQWFAKMEKLGAKGE